MAQRPKPQPIRIRVDRSGRLGGDIASGGGGGGGCGISKCRSFPRFLHSGAGSGGSGGGGGSGGDGGSGGGGADAGDGSRASGNTALLEVPFKTVASGLSFGGSASSMGSLGGQSSAASLDVHAPSIHPDSPASASMLWCKRSESCPCLVRGPQHWALPQQLQEQQSQLSQDQTDGGLQSRSERASPVPQRSAAATMDTSQVAKEAIAQSLAGKAEAPAAPVAVAATAAQDCVPEEDTSPLKRFTGGSTLNRQTRRSRRKCEEWIGKLDYS